MFRNTDWYESKMRRIVNSDLNKFLDQKKIHYEAVVAVYKNHLAQVIKHYEELKQPTGVLPGYQTAIDLGLQIEIPELVKAGANYLHEKFVLGQRRPQFSGKVKVAMDAAKQFAPIEPDGRKRLLQVNCEAERDFMKLTLRYVDFFIISKTYHNGYSPWQVNLALKVPGVKAVIAKKMEAANKLLSQFKPKPIVDEKITLGMTP